MIKQPESVTLFISYAHEDEKLRQELEAHLKGLERRRLISIWHDRQITAGAERVQTIDAHLEQAEIILLLMSPNFVNSDNCWREAKRAWQRHVDNKARVVPIVIRPCDWSHTPLGKLQYLPPDGKSVAERNDRDTAWNEVAREINRVVEEFVDIKVCKKSQPRMLANTEKKPEEILSLIGLPMDVEILSEKAEPRSLLPLIPQRPPSPRKRAIPRRLLISSLLAAVAVIGSLLLYNLLKPPPWISVDASFGNWPQATQSKNGCSYSNHFYHDWQTALNNAHICLMPGKPFTDVDFEVQMQIQQGECGGIVFRADSTLAHYYDLVVCPSQDVSLKKRLSANDISLLGGTSTRWSTVDPQNSYIVRLVAQGSSFSTFINGQRVPISSDSSDSPYTSGLVGVITVTLSKSADVLFSNPILLVR